MSNAAAAPHRRRRTSGVIPVSTNVSSSSNNQSHNNNPYHHSSSPDSKKSRSFWSSLQIRMARFKHHTKSATSDSERSGVDTLLPTTYSTKSNSSSQSHVSSPNHRKSITSTSSAASQKQKLIRTNLCASMNNSFLMGGVDKRRFRKKKRGLIYRIFWSSLPRRLTVSFIALYVFVFHVLAPLGVWLIEVGLGWDAGNDLVGTNRNARSGKQILAQLQHSPIFDNLPSIRQEKAALRKLEAERARIREYGSGTLPPFSKALEEIAPAWYHRFDSELDPKLFEDAAAGDDNGDDVGNVAAKKAENSEENGGKANPVVKNTSNKTTKKKRYQTVVSGTTHRRLLEVTGGIAATEVAHMDEEQTILLPQRTLANMDDMGATYSSCGWPDDHATTTLVVQTSIDRMWILGETCSRWTKDPIVAVVFVPHASTFEEQDGGGDFERHKLLEQLHLTEEKLLGSSDQKGVCPNLTIVRYKADRIESLRGHYPVNRLRNIGLDMVKTSHVLVMDVDFVPSKDLDKLVSNAISDTSSSHHHRHRRALVVPAFEKRMPPECAGSDDPITCISKLLTSDGAFLPRTFDELKECYNSSKKDCIVFQSKVNWDGHSTTMSDGWMKGHWYEDDTIANDPATKPTDGKKNEKTFRKIPCFHTARYEPYVVVEWCPNKNDDSSKHSNTDSKNNPLAPVSPYYDERFYGYGKNKIELVSHLRRSNYRFEVLPEGFLVHNPHPESSTKETWLNQDQSNDLHATMDSLYVKFMGELDTKYQSVHQDTTKLCKH